MGSLYKKKLMSGTPGAIWWAKYYVNGRPIRESTGTANHAEAKRFLLQRERGALEGASFARLRRLAAWPTSPPSVRYPLLAGEQLADAKRPLVYLYIAEACITYVGASSLGLVRPLGRHHVLAHRTIGPRDVLLSLPMASWKPSSLKRSSSPRFGPSGIRAACLVDDAARPRGSRPFPSIIWAPSRRPTPTKEGPDPWRK
jgi:hypothetical protein